MLKDRNYTLSCILSEDAKQRFEDFALHYAKFLILMMILQSAFLLVLIGNILRTLSNSQQRKRLNWYTISQYSLQLLIMVLDLFWSAYFYQGNFMQCFYIGQLVYGDVVILTTSMVLMLCYVSHSVCSQVHAFSTQQRLINDKERKVKDALAISILALTVIILAVWWIVNAYF